MNLRKFRPLGSKRKLPDEIAKNRSPGVFSEEFICQQDSDVSNILRKMSKKLLREREKKTAGFNNSSSSVDTSEYRLKSQGYSGGLEASDDEMI